MKKILVSLMACASLVAGVLSPVAGAKEATPTGFDRWKPNAIPTKTVKQFVPNQDVFPELTFDDVTTPKVTESLTIDQLRNTGEWPNVIWQKADGHQYYAYTADNENPGPLQLTARITLGGKDLELPATINIVATEASNWYVGRLEGEKTDNHLFYGESLPIHGFLRHRTNREIQPSVPVKATMLERIGEKYVAPQTNNWSYTFDSATGAGTVTRSDKQSAEEATIALVKLATTFPDGSVASREVYLFPQRYSSFFDINLPSYPDELKTYYVEAGKPQTIAFPGLTRADYFTGPDPQGLKYSAEIFNKDNVDPETDWRVKADENTGTLTVTTPKILEFDPTKAEARETIEWKVTFPDGSNDSKVFNVAWNSEAVKEKDLEEPTVAFKKTATDTVIEVAKKAAPTATSFTFGPNNQSVSWVMGTDSIACLAGSFTCYYMNLDENTGKLTFKDNPKLEAGRYLTMLTAHYPDQSKRTFTISMVAIGDKSEYLNKATSRVEEVPSDSYPGDTHTVRYKKKRLLGARQTK